jgi:hypothetical protein
MPISLINRNNQGRINLQNNGTGQIYALVSSTPSVAVTGSPWQQINTITSYLRNYVSDFRNPQFYIYRLDGNQYQINDAGNDMFDGGNYTIPALRNGTQYTASSTVAIPPALSYLSQSATLTDTNYYFASFGYSQSAGALTTSPQSPIYHPLTMIGARSGSGPIGWQKAGNIGADGAGSIATGSVYTGSTVNGFTTYAYYRQTYGEGSDPNICDVYMLFGHPNWNSDFGNVVWSVNLNRGLQGAALYSTGSASNLLAVTTLLSRTGSTANSPSLPISASDITNVVNNFTLRIKEALSF